MKLTKFQTRVLKVLRAIGPADYSQIRQHFRKPQGVKKAVYRLRLAGLAERTAVDEFDVTKNGRGHLQ